MTIKQYTTEQLKQELQDREGMNYIPPIITNPDHSSSELLAASYLDDEINGLEIDAQYSYENLMETYYGDNFFDWVNDLPHNK